MKILNTKYLILNTVNGAYKSLRALLDPAVEGNPYVVGEGETALREEKKGFFLRRRWALR